MIGGDIITLNSMRGKRISEHIVYSLLISASFLISLFILSSHGSSSRALASRPVVIGKKVPEIMVVRDQKEIFYIWKKAGLHGRIVLHFNTFLNMKPLEGINKQIVSGFYPGLLESITKESGGALEDENFMLFAVADGVVRKVIGIVPEDIFPEIEKELTGSRYINYGEYYRSVSMIEGSPKIVTTLKNLTALDEAVLMDFDARFFSAPDIVPERVYDALKGLMIKTDLIVCSLSENEEGITSEGIEKMNRFIRLLKTHEEGV